MNMAIELFHRLTVLVALCFTVFGGYIMLELLIAKYFARSADRFIAQLDRLENALHAFAQSKLQDALLDDAVAEEARISADSKRAEAERALRIAVRVGGLGRA